MGNRWLTNKPDFLKMVSDKLKVFLGAPIFKFEEKVDKSIEAAAKFIERRIYDEISEAANFIWEHTHAESGDVLEFNSYLQIKDNGQIKYKAVRKTFDQIQVGEWFKFAPEEDEALCIKIPPVGYLVAITEEGQHIYRNEITNELIYVGNVDLKVNHHLIEVDTNEQWT